MVDVGVWQPDENGVTLDSATLERLALAAQHIDAPTFGLTPREVARFASVMRHAPSQWTALLGEQADARLIELVRFFTLAEMRLAGWEAQAQSPVIPIVAELRRRKSYPAQLTSWIKSNTTNRFLPYGSLLDKL